jgi:hypothetical protein
VRGLYELHQGKDGLSQAYIILRIQVFLVVKRTVAKKTLDSQSLVPGLGDLKDSYCDFLTCVGNS